MIRRALWPLWRCWLIAFYRWARREMHPLHPDLPFVMHRLNELERS